MLLCPYPAVEGKGGGVRVGNTLMSAWAEIQSSSFRLEKKNAVLFFSLESRRALVGTAVISKSRALGCYISRSIGEEAVGDKIEVSPSVRTAWRVSSEDANE